MVTGIMAGIRADIMAGIVADMVAGMVAVWCATIGGWYPENYKRRCIVRPVLILVGNICGSTRSNICNICSTTINSQQKKSGLIHHGHTLLNKLN